MTDKNNPETGDTGGGTNDDTLLNIPVLGSDTTAPKETELEQPADDGATLFAIGANDASQSILFQIDQAAGCDLSGASIDLPASDTSAETQSSQSFTERHTSGRLNKMRYDELGELGRGGMGVVMKVKDNDLRREVAMKVIRADRRSDAAMHSFVEEAQITGQLEHPNIVPVHELGTDADGKIYFTMKMVRGQPLSQVLRAIRHGDADTASRHTLDRLLQILLKVCDAVSFAAARGVVHRDLKPENIMLGRFGEVVVMDWGLARVHGQSTKKSQQTSIFTDHTIKKATESETNPSSAFSMEGSIAGTPAYMAPEQARGEISKINESTDVFALGAILCEILCLRGPYLARGRKDTLEEAADGDVTTPLERVDIDNELKERLTHLPNKRIPPELDAIAAKAMQTRQKDRYESVRTFKHDLENFIAGRPVTVHKDSLPIQVAKWVRRHPTLSFSSAAAAAVILIAAAVIGLVVAEKERQDAVQSQHLADARQEQVETSKKAAEASQRAADLYESEAEAQRKAAEANKREAEAQKIAAEASKKAADDAEKLAKIEADAADKERERTDAERRRADKLKNRNRAEKAYQKGAAIADRALNFADPKLRAVAVAQAVTALKIAINIDSEFVEPVYKLARILDFTGDKRALDYYAKASELKNGDSKALLYAGDFAGLRLGSTRSAKSYYTECSEISKTHPLSIVAAGHLALMNNNPRRAMSHARSAKKADKNLWEPWFLSGSIRAIEILPNGEQNTEFNPRLAAKHFAEAEKRSLSEGAIPRARGVALLAAGKLDEAIADLERAVRIYPKWLDPQIDLSEAYLSRGRFPDAAKLMLPHMIIQHENSDVAFILGAIKFQEGEFSKANDLLNRARKLDGDHLRAKNWLTKTLIRMNDFEGAAKNAKFTIKEHPASAYAHSMYAVALTKVDKYEDALAQVDKALRLRPGWPVALTVKALTTSTNSMRLCQTALETEGQWASPHALLGQQYLDKAIYDRTSATFKKAETHLLKALSINSTLVNTRFLLAWLYKETDRYQQSIMMASQIHKDPVLSTATKSLLGDCHFSMGEYSAAEVWFIKAGESNPEFGDAWTKASECAIKLGKFEKARDYAYKAAKAWPYSIRSWVRVCKAELKLNNDEKAETAIDTALECYWSKPEDWVDVADVLMNLGRHLEAIDCCDQVVERFPEFSKAWETKGLANQKLTRSDKALKAFESAAKAAPKSIVPLLYIMKLHWLKVRHTNCIETAKKVLELKPHHAVAHYYAGASWAAIGEYRVAVEHLELSVKRDPNNHDTLYQLVNSLYLLKEWARCAQNADLLTTLFPESELGWRLMGGSYFGLARWESAVDAYSQAVTINSQDFTTRVDLAYALQKLGKYEDALEQALKARLLVPNSVVTIQRVAFIEYDLKHFEKAAIGFEECAKVDPDGIYWHYYAALTWAEKGDHAKALVDAKLATEHQNRDIDAFVVLARSQVALGQHAEALKSLRTALVGNVPDAATRIFGNEWFKDLHETDGWKSLKKDFPTD